VIVVPAFNHVRAPKRGRKSGYNRRYSVSRLRRSGRRDGPRASRSGVRRKHSTSLTTWLKSLST